MQYPAHDYTRPEAVAKLRNVSSYPACLAGSCDARLETFGHAIVRSVIGGYELLITAEALARVPASKVRHLAHEKRIFDTPNGFASLVLATFEDKEPIKLLFRRDGWAIAVWLEGEDAPPIRYLDEPVRAQRVEVLRADKWRRVAIVSLCFAVIMALVESFALPRLAGVVAAGALVLVGAVVAKKSTGG